MVDDLGMIHYSENKLALKTIYQLNTYNTAMLLLGKIAKAVLVRRCNENENINKKWFSLARRKKAKTDTALRFHALGTGLEKTKDLWKARYNPTDPQRDIIWVDFKKGAIANMKGSTKIAGLEAGLQVKVSGDGCRYFLNDLYDVKYEVPVVYFDINNDFNIVASKLIEYRQKKDESKTYINEDFICAKAVDYDAFQEVYYYVDLVIALLEQRIQPEELIIEAEKYASLMNAVSAAGLESIGIGTKIFH